MTLSEKEKSTAVLEEAFPEVDETRKDWRKLVAKVGAGAGLASVFAGLSAPNPLKAQAVAVQATCPVPIGGPSSAHKLASKATFGYFGALEQEIITKGYSIWLKEQIDYQNLPGWVAFENNLATTYPAIATPVGDDAFCCASFQVRQENRRELQKARVIRAYSSPAQLYERVVEFWTDHLNTFALTPNLDRMKVFEDRDVIRANAMGKLSEMIYASATSPAMLVYLDGNSNSVGNPNENYAREILELQTLGANVCYDEMTIQELAKALTGWRVNLSLTCPNNNCGMVTFNNSQHDNTAKTLVFTCNQFSIPMNSGQSELDLVIEMLTDPFKLDDFGNPNLLAEATVKHIARKLATYFLHCNPKDFIVEDMWTAYKTAYQHGRNDIAVMMLELFKESNIHCSGPLLKRPLHLVASTMRALAGTITDPGDEDSPNTLMGGFLRSAGHIPYFWPAPNGYPPPCDLDYWGANLLERQNLGAALFDITPPFTGVTGTNMLLAAQAVLGAASTQDVVDLLDSVVFGGFMPAFDKARILAYMDSTVDILARVEALGLLVGSPGFQWY